MNSALKGPSSTTSPALTSRRSACSITLCSRNLFLMKPMFSSYSSAIILRPISPSPPSGMARKRDRLAKKGELFLRPGDRPGGGGYQPPSLLHPIKINLDRVEVLPQWPHQKTVIQRG